MVHKKIRSRQVLHLGRKRSSRLNPNFEVLRQHLVQLLVRVLLAEAVVLRQFLQEDRCSRTVLVGIAQRPDIQNCSEVYAAIRARNSPLWDKAKNFLLTVSDSPQAE